MQYKKPENFTHFGAKSNLKRRFLRASFVMSTIFFVYHCFQREIFAHITLVDPQSNITLSGLGNPVASCLSCHASSWPTRHFSFSSSCAAFRRIA
ncbi:hypothetical protein CS535_09900 [Yersinia massiliensis]|uniref:Uncharacterized protein n=1 Tax=Yersinia massiliensis TaxID=419257 RepID=A0ABM6UWM5_9GAMM|nr:hypothetical protein CRN74_01140 [Yersinia frederiksenii]AVX39311.1 hypothetical protein DA391_17540 [Yersinia massiliensis]PHZ23646.1 hypothetical protein CS535_09900 [Yersinia massiliensis]